jgi:hypothetical protein
MKCLPKYPNSASDFGPWIPHLFARRSVERIMSDLGALPLGLRPIPFNFQLLLGAPLFDFIGMPQEMPAFSPSGHHGSGCAPN